MEPKKTNTSPGQRTTSRSLEHLHKRMKLHNAFQHQLRRKNLSKKNPTLKDLIFEKNVYKFSRSWKTSNSEELGEKKWEILIEKLLSVWYRQENFAQQRKETPKARHDRVKCSICLTMKFSTRNYKTFCYHEYRNPHENDFLSLILFGSSEVNFFMKLLKISIVLKPTLPIT